ncbi:MAG TPA: hypothetical protein VL500_03385 [Candidatus Eisenbacteria bacterium]|nr:hypothetical protein [Candidatus Eisenbacteria bacterium]
MHDLFSSFVLWLAVAAEVAIFSYVIGASIKYCVPWDELRAKKAVRLMLKERLPVLRGRVRGLLARSREPLRRYRGRWARDLSEGITRDASRLLVLASASIDSIERHLGQYPFEAARIERDVSSTLDIIEKMLSLRDARLPAIVRERSAFARELLADLSGLRDHVAARADECAGLGVKLAYETRIITLLANAFRAHAATAEDDPSRVFELFPMWLDRIRKTAESIEIRAAVTGRIARIAEEMPVRASHARRMVADAQPLIVMLRADPSVRSGGRLAALTAAASTIESAENRVRAAQALIAEEGTDIGAKGVSAQRVKEALLIAERAAASLIVLEEGLAIAIAAYGAGGSSRSN